MPSRASLFISLPAAGALLLTTYLYNAPLSRSKTRTIHISENLTPSTLSSNSLNSIVNPRHHKLITDSRSIILSKAETKNLSDEEILARFLKGFFGGWIFTPEITLIATLRGMGLPFIPVGYSSTFLYSLKPALKDQVPILYIAVKPIGPILQSPSQLSRTTLPPPHTLLFGGNFMVLDTNIKSQDSSSDEKQSSENSYVEIGFGDDRKNFAGMHRFEISRPEKGGVQISFSSVSVNPSMNTAPFSNFVFVFHKFYAQCLFRDAVREVLSD
jgi:hypothetical protein